MKMKGKAARYLRGLAHHLEPVVLIGAGGVTAAVILKTDTELEYHELIKIKLVDADRDDTKAAAQRLCEETGASLAQIIGRTVVLYRAREKKPGIVIPDFGG
jgi:RNA-binding protein